MSSCLSLVTSLHSPYLPTRTQTQVDQNIRSYLALKAADRWLSVRLELLGAVVVACGAILSVQGASKVQLSTSLRVHLPTYLCTNADLHTDVHTTQGRLGAGLAGLAITNALGVTGLLNWAVRCLAETEAMMNSVERVMQLVEKVPSEAPALIEG